MRRASRGSVRESQTCPRRGKKNHEKEPNETFFETVAFHLSPHMDQKPFVQFSLYFSICIFRFKVDIDSDSRSPLIPEQSRHRFRLKVATFFRIPESEVSEATLDNFNVVSHHIPSEKERRMRWHKRGYPCVKSKRSCV